MVYSLTLSYVSLASKATLKVTLKSLYFNTRINLGYYKLIAPQLSATEPAARCLSKQRDSDILLPLAYLHWFIPTF